MNPGLLKHPVRIERPASGADDLGQPLEGWTRVGVCFARRLRSKATAEEVIADRETEGQSAVFRARTRPFVGWYRDGDRLVEPSRNGLPEVIWRITGWTEVEGSNGMFVDVTAKELARHNRETAHDDI